MKQTPFVKAVKSVLKATVYCDGAVRQILFGPARGLRYRIFPEFGLSPLFGGWEPEAQRAMVRHLSAGRVAYDIGANYGMHSLLMARLVGSRGRVYAFEPVPQINAALRENISFNRLSNVHVVEAAVSNENGQTSFFRGIHEGQGHLRVAASENSQSISVKSITLDRFVFEDKAAPPNFIKMDVEGAEGRVLEGADRVLAQYHPVLLIDLHSPEQDVAVGRSLSKHGYTAWRTDGSRIRDFSKAWPVPEGIWGQILCIG